MALDKTTLYESIKRTLERAQRMKESDIDRNNDIIAKGISDAVDRYVKGAQVDITGLKMLPGTQVMVNPGIATAGSPASQTSISPGSGMTTAQANLDPSTGIDCGKLK